MTRNQPQSLFGGIECGGTKFNCAVGNGPQDLIAEARFATTSPLETIGQVKGFFAPYVSRLKGIGLGSFGPLDLDRASPTYGYITATPKLHWTDTNLLGILEREIEVPIVLEMDTVVSGIGEAKWGASKNDSNSLYVTIGTGIGGGYIVQGKALYGLAPLEMGHIRVLHDLVRDPFRGACPYHGDCLEGLASGSALDKRFGLNGKILPEGNPFWDIEADYIAQALANYTLSLAPHRIVLGGGIMENAFLFGPVRRKFQELLNGYIKHELILSRIDEYIVAPALGSRSGVLGAIALAMGAVSG